MKRTLGLGFDSLCRSVRQLPSLAGFDLNLAHSSKLVNGFDETLLFIKLPKVHLFQLLKPEDLLLFSVSYQCKVKTFTLGSKQAPSGSDLRLCEASDILETRGTRRTSSLETGQWLETTASPAEVSKHVTLLLTCYLGSKTPTHTTCSCAVTRATPCWFGAAQMWRFAELVLESSL